MLTPELKPLGSFANGARVRKLNALCFDFAFERIGTVCREEWEDGKEHLGVKWDGGVSIFEYPAEYLFAECRDDCSRAL